MLHLSPESENKLYLVTDDIVIIDDPIYLWRFVHEITEVEYLIELTNELEDNKRADLFTLVLPDDLDLKGGKHRYYVYESDAAGKTDYENMRLLADGRADVTTEFEEDKTYSDNGTDTVYRITDE